MNQEFTPGDRAFMCVLGVMLVMLLIVILYDNHKDPTPQYDGLRGSEAQSLDNSKGGQ